MNNITLFIDLSFAHEIDDAEIDRLRTRIRDEETLFSVLETLEVQGLVTNVTGDVCYSENN